jgi:hypothetical protein
MFLVQAHPEILLDACDLLYCLFYKNDDELHELPAVICEGFRAISCSDILVIIISSVLCQ